MSNHPHDGHDMDDCDAIRHCLTRATELFSSGSPAVRDGIDPRVRLDGGETVTVLRSGRVLVLADGAIHTVDATLGSVDGREAAEGLVEAARRAVRAAWNA